MPVPRVARSPASGGGGCGPGEQVCAIGVRQPVPVRVVDHPALPACFLLAEPEESLELRAPGILPPGDRRQGPWDRPDLHDRDAVGAGQRPRFAEERDPRWIRAKGIKEIVVTGVEAVGYR